MLQTERLPAYVRRKNLRTGKAAYFWELPPWARPERDRSTGLSKPRVRHGRACGLVSTALGTNLSEAIARADALNEALRQWRTGEGRAEVVEGSIAWLFAWYRDQPRFTKNKAKTRADYRKLMDMLSARPDKAGVPFGRRLAGKVDATTADTLYARLRADTGERQATYAMQVCRLVWTWAVRHKRATKVSENPFAGMGLKSTAAKGNRATSRAEYDLYRRTAHALGYPSMAAAAALCFECCQRVTDAFGYEEPDGVDRGIKWEGYRPGEEIALRQSKTGNIVVLPLTIDVAGERVKLYPDLEAELGALVRPPGGGIIIVEERSGARYKERRMSSVHRAICVEAGLPKDMTFTGFRHGGITEIGDAGEADVRAVSGHKTLAVTGIYNKASAEKARRIAVARREHVIALGAAEEAKRGTD